MKRIRNPFGMFMIVVVLLAQTGCGLVTKRSVAVEVAKVVYKKVTNDKAKNE